MAARRQQGAKGRGAARTQTVEPQGLPARDLNAAGRALAALDLALKGHNYVEIAKLAGYASRGAAFTAVQRELARTLQHKADDLRTLEGQRLDALLVAMMPKALSGDTWSVDRVLAIMERRARLFGLDTPADAQLAASNYTKRVVLEDAAPGRGTLDDLLIPAPGAARREESEPAA